MTAEYRKGLILLLVVAAVVIGAGLGLRDPWPADEPRFALIARDMAETGSWLIPNVGGVLYPDKPPLHFWLVATLYALSGSLRISFLVPAMLAGLGTLFLVADLGRRVWGEREGLWCGAVLLAMLQFPLQMKSGQLDGPLCFWTTLSLYGLLRHLLLGPNWQWYAVGGAAAGFGVITKGVGFLPYLVLLPYAFAAIRHWPRPAIEGGWRWLLAPALTLGVIAIWLVPMLLATGNSSEPAMLEYRNNILFHQTVARYADSWGHIKPPWYLLTNAVPWLWFPATLILPWLLPRWWRDIHDRKNISLLLLGGWVLLVLAFFSLSAGKRSVYIFPAAPAFALIVGLYVPRLLEKVLVRRVLAVLSPLIGLLFVAVGMFGLMNPHEIAAWITDVATIFRVMLVLVVVGVLLFAYGALMAWRQPVHALAVSLTVLWLTVSLSIYPPIDDARSGRVTMRAAEAATAPTETLALIGWPEQFLLQATRPIVHFGYRRNAKDEMAEALGWLTEDSHRRILVAERQLPDCVDVDRAQRIALAHRRNWVLVGKDAIVGHCEAVAPPENAIVYHYPRHERRALRLTASWR